jgi:hypothetical protein
MKEQRSTIAQENLQEILDAGGSAGSNLMTGQAQYFTPPWFVDQCNARLPMGKGRGPDSVLDPQFGEGSLVNMPGWNVNRFGVDIDNRLDDTQLTQNRLIVGNCVKVFETLDELFPDLRFECANANPPFGKLWKVAGGNSLVDSTEWTWKLVTKRACYGYFIASHPVLVKLGIDKHPWVTHYEQHDGTEIWKGMRAGFTIGVAFWARPKDDPTVPLESASYRRPWKVTNVADLSSAWEQVKKIIDEEKGSRPKWNIYLDKAGFLKTYLSLRSEVKLKLSAVQIRKLHSINGAHPLTLTTEKESRHLMRDLVNCGIYTIDPEAKAAIDQALIEVNSQACPIMPITDFEAVAYADEEEALEALTDVKGPNYWLTKGKRYDITTATYKFQDQLKRTKAHFNEKTFQTYTVDHECTLSGQDRYIQIIDDRRISHRFMDRPTKGVTFEHPEADLWKLFKRPVVKTIADTQSALIDQNAAVLKSCEMMAGYEYYPGQFTYLSRVATRDHALVAAATGTGKTLMALSLLGMKCPERALIIAPQGTMRSSENLDDGDDEESEEFNASQWVQEINRFTPHLQIWELFKYEDYERICSLNGGTLPPGVYVSYYQAMFLNGARESAPPTWDDDKLNKHIATTYKLPPLEKPEALKTEKRLYCDTLGAEKNGIRCIIAPCLASRIGHLFDMVLLDEAHVCTNIEANVTQMLVRMQPKYRYALTATPIPNIISNLFSLLGWLAVPGWYRGKVRNAAWPYAREDLWRFNNTFLSEERDLTQEDMNKARDPRWRGKCVKTSPMISSPARLLKLLKPTMAFIDKPACNASYVKPQLIDVRVPLGKEQSVLYAYYLDRANIPGNALVRARRQIAWLRSICTDPKGFRHGTERTPKVNSNMNPKVIAVLELTRDILAEGKQLIIINSRIGLTETIQRKLAEAGVPMARIDSTIPAEQHAYQANLFKRGKARVLLMGLKCAAAYSFDQCERLIVSSIEYSPGPLNQAIGRIDRVTNHVLKKIYCLLHKHTIEEVMFDIVAVKDDAATICLRGQRVPRDFKPVDGSEILAMAIDRFDVTGSTPEMDCEGKWPKLREAIRYSMVTIPEAGSLTE